MAFGLLSMVVRRFGIKGVIIAAIGFFALWQLNILDPSMLLGGGGAARPVATLSSEEETERFEFVERVLARTEDVWKAEFERVGRSYKLPILQVYTGRTNTACGMGRAEMGPFYCPGDEKIYIDLSFYDELAKTFKAPGDFAQAYVIAHEVGHHVQHLLGDLSKVAARRGKADYNQMSVRLELQADFYAGVWARHSLEYFELTEEDLQEAMRAANAIGDDAIQLRQQGRVVPHAFTHGTSEQRMRWFQKGLDAGRMEEGDTFAMPYEQL